MYSLPHFKENDLDVVKQFMHQHPFIMLCGCDADHRPVVTHVPVLIKENDHQLFLRGHIMKNTDHYKAYIQNPLVLAVFTGPHAYISASWYGNPQQASTWNYMTVHAKGRIEFLDDAALLDTLKETTARFENDMHSPSLFEKLPAEYVQRMKNAIIAFNLEVLELENVFKLSQNRDEKSYQNIISKLLQGSPEEKQVALEMQQRISQLFH